MSLNFGGSLADQVVLKCGALYYPSQAKVKKKVRQKVAEILLIDSEGFQCSHRFVFTAQVY